MNNYTAPQRLQKWLAELGLCSRRKAEEWIQQGRVSINTKVVKKLGVTLSPGADLLKIDGNKIFAKPPPKVYWMFHKPKKYLTSHKRVDKRSIIFDLPVFSKLPFRVVSAGRLDYMTEGLLILSNDGDFVYRLMHPSYSVPRHYQICVDSKLSQLQLSTIQQGLQLSDGVINNIRVQFAHSVKLGRSIGFWYFVTVYEGRNRLVRRVFEHFSCRVISLIRYGLAQLRLPEDLPCGKYRQLSKQDIRKMKHVLRL